MGNIETSKMISDILGLIFEFVDDFELALSLLDKYKLNGRLFAEFNPILKKHWVKIRARCSPQNVFIHYPCCLDLTPFSQCDTVWVSYTGIPHYMYQTNNYPKLNLLPLGKCRVVKLMRYVPDENNLRVLSGCKHVYMDRAFINWSESTKKQRQYLVDCGVKVYG